MPYAREILSTFVIAPAFAGVFAFLARRMRVVGGRGALMVAGLVLAYAVAHVGVARQAPLRPLTAEHWRLWCVVLGGVILGLVRWQGVRGVVWFGSVGILGAASGALVLHRKVAHGDWGAIELAGAASAMGVCVAVFSGLAMRVARRCGTRIGIGMVALLGVVLSAVLGMTWGGAYASAGLIGAGLALGLGAQAALGPVAQVDLAPVFAIASLVYGLMLTEARVWASLEPGLALVAALATFFVAVAVGLVARGRGEPGSRKVDEGLR